MGTQQLQSLQSALLQRVDTFLGSCTSGEVEISFGLYQHTMFPLVVEV